MEQKPIKQVIIVRKDLNMRKGKIAAQVAHASMKVILDLLEWEPESSFHKHPVISASLTLDAESPIFKWLTSSFAKICVSVDSEEELIDLYEKAKQAEIPCALITDSGKTEFHGVPTKTCFAIGPWYAEEIDKITGKLKLL